MKIAPSCISTSALVLLVFQRYYINSILEGKVNPTGDLIKRPFIFTGWTECRGPEKLSLSRRRTAGWQFHTRIFVLKPQTLHVLSISKFMSASMNS